MPKKEIIYDKNFNFMIETATYEEIKKRAYEQKRSLAQVARAMFEKCIEREDEIEINMYKDIKEIKATQIEFQDFMKKWMTRKELNEDK